MSTAARAAGLPALIAGIVIGLTLAWVVGFASSARASDSPAVPAEASAARHVHDPARHDPAWEEPSSASAIRAAPPDFETGPAPPWVIPVEVPDDAGVSSDLLHDGVADLLSDAQIRVGDGPQQVFNRYVSEVVEPSGVSAVGRIQIEFAATYQKLVIHWIRLVRDGRSQNRLDPARIRILQQEEDLDLHLYYQHATALVLLDDVRVGDRVDYAYSIVGANPIFEGRYMDWLYLEWWFPFGRIHNRILAPETRPLYFELHRTDEAPEIRPVDGEPGWLEYVWQADSVPAAMGEDGTPGDFDPLAAHQVSEFESWGDVARWASRVFAGSTVPDDAVRARAEAIREAHDDPAEQIIAALRFVQDEVRYLGLEIGVNAYRPHAPGLTLERRFGDCKDKSALLVALLTELGIDARVALVNTELGPSIARQHPTADVFDHAIVRVRHGGRDYWLDPTASYERGPLEDEEWFDYGFALIVDPSIETLTVVEPPEAELLPSMVEHVYLTEDYEGPTRLGVRSTYRGDRADAFRAWAASNATDSIERQYQNYYARDLPGIELAEPLRIEDDEATNTIVVTEQYTVPALWEWDEERERYTASFVARELRDELSTPDTVQRSQPLATSHPVRTTVTVHIHAPEEMDLRPHHERIEGPAFDLDMRVHGDERHVLVEYDYASTADRVAPEDVEDHLEAVNAAFAATRYRLGSSTTRFGAGGELGGGIREVDRWRFEFLAVIAAFAALLAACLVSAPRNLLRNGLFRVDLGIMENGTRLMELASGLTPVTWGGAGYIELALSIALGLWGRTDEALGRVAWLTRRPAKGDRSRAVLAAAWAWRAELTAVSRGIETEAGSGIRAAGAAAGQGAPLDRALGFADRAVELARTIPGVRGWRVRRCALACRAGLRARRGALDAARRDLDEARAHRIGPFRAKQDFSKLARYIASIRRAECLLARAAGDTETAVETTRARLELIEQSWVPTHPLATEAWLDHVEALFEASLTSEARDALDQASWRLHDGIDIESPLRSRADALHDILSHD